MRVRHPGLFVMSHWIPLNFLILRTEMEIGIILNIISVERKKPYHNIQFKE